MVPTAKQGHQQLYSNTENTTDKGSRDGWKILQSKKADSPTALRSPGLSHQAPSLSSFFHLIMFVTAHTLILGRANPEHCYPNEPCMSPPSQPAWQTTLGFYLPLFHLPFRFCRRHSSSHVAQTQEHPPCLCTALHFGQRGCKNMCQSQRCWP